MPNNPNSFNNNIVLSISGDSDNNIWIGTDGGGLNQFDPRTHDFTNYWNDQSNRNNIHNDYVLSSTEYIPGVLALGFHRGGLIYLMYKSKYLPTIRPKI